MVISKSLVQKPRLVIFDEPTRGVDVGTIAEVHQIINGLANEGSAVVVISSYLPEVYELADTLHVFRRGRVVASHSFKDASHEDILGQAIGV